MRKMRWKRLAAFALAVLLFAGSGTCRSAGTGVRIGGIGILRQDPAGKTGKSLTVSFTIKNTSGSEIKDAKIAFDTSGGEIWDEDEEDRQYGYSFPFEVTGKLNDTDHPKGIGSISDGKREEGISDRYGTTGSVRGLL